MATITTIPSPLISNIPGTLTYSNPSVLPSIADTYVLNNSSGNAVSDSLVTGAMFASGMTEPTGICFDKFDNLYITSDSARYIIKVSPSGTVNTIFGNNTYTYAASGLAFDSQGYLYVTYFRNGNYQGTISKINLTNNSSVIFAIVPANADGHTPPRCIAIDGSDNIYFPVQNGSNCVVYKIPQSSQGNTNIDSSFIFATLSTGNTFQPYGAAFDNLGNLYIASKPAYYSNYSYIFNTGAATLQKITNTGVVTTILSTSDGFNGCLNMCFDKTFNNLFIACISSSIDYQLSGPTSIARVTFDNFGNKTGFTKNFFTGTQVIAPYSISFNSSGTLYFSNSFLNNTIYKINISDNSFRFTGVTLPSGNQTLTLYDSTQSTAKTTFNIQVPYVPCFKKGTKICCIDVSTETNEEIEIYMNIEDIRPGMIVKTYYDGGQRPVKIIGSSKVFNSTNEEDNNRLFKLSKDKCSDLMEDLYLTGNNSLLVDSLTDEEKSKMDKLLWPLDIYKIYYKYKLLAGYSSMCEPVCDESVETIYHIVLEEPDIYFNYGIWANGVLAESCTEWAMRELSSFELIV